jgi:TolB-like protein/DNA-binding winged helix-turn-helix (wHTH) protein
MSDPAAVPRLLHFGNFEVDLWTGELRKSGQRIRLNRQPIEVLAVLLEHAGELVTREELRKTLWPDDTFVEFDHSLNTAINKIRDALGDDATDPRFIETLPRRGYRFIAPVVGVGGTRPDAEARLEPAPTVAPGEVVVPVSSAAGGGAATVAAPAAAGPRVGGVGRAEDIARRVVLWKRIALAAGLAVAALAVVIGLNPAGLRDRVLRAVGAAREPPVQIRSIAVLPLENLSGDPEQEYFADGMTSELIVALGKLGGLRVISRTSVMRYKRTKTPLPQIAKELGVDAVIEGTVVRSGNHVRITAQLIQASTDRYLWAETYERDLRDVLALQEEVARAIAGQIKMKLTPRGKEPKP